MNRTTWLQDRRMQKFRDVLSRWESGGLSMLEAGELLGMSERQFRRYRERYAEVRGLLEAFGANGLPGSLYTDRGSHYFFTPKAGEGVDRVRLTQVGRALDRLGIEHIPAYSPEARGRSERMFGTLQDRLPKELKLAGIADMASANRFIREVYLPAHNARFARAPALPESAFVTVRDPTSLADILCIEEDRVVARDNTVAYGGLRLQLPQSPARAHYVKARVRIHHYQDGSLAIFLGPRPIAYYTTDGEPIDTPTLPAADRRVIRLDATPKPVWTCGQPLPRLPTAPTSQTQTEADN